MQTSLLQIICAYETILLFSCMTSLTGILDNIGWLIVVSAADTFVGSLLNYYNSFFSFLFTISFSIYLISTNANYSIRHGIKHLKKRLLCSGCGDSLFSCTICCWVWALVTAVKTWSSAVLD